MSVFRRHGPLKRASGMMNFISDQLKLLDLRPVSSVVYKFDPFYHNVRSFRNLMFYLSSPKIRDTNFNCRFKTEVKCDHSQPEMLVKLEDGRQIKFEAGNLSTLEILQELNRIVLPLVPAPEDEAANQPKQTKSQKKK